jgi:hypothetical protein
MPISKYGSKAKFEHTRLQEPQLFDSRSFRVVKVNPNVRIVVGCKKGNWDNKSQVCNVGTQAQSILRRKIKQGGVRTMARAKDGRRTTARKGFKFVTLSYKSSATGKKMTYRQQVPIGAAVRGRKPATGRGRPAKAVGYKTYSFISGKTGKKVTYKRYVGGAKKAGHRGRPKIHDGVKTYSYFNTKLKKVVTYRRHLKDGRAHKTKIIHYTQAPEEIESIVLSQPAYYRKLLRMQAAARRHKRK